jgi:hypothetical protein
LHTDVIEATASVASPARTNRASSRALRSGHCHVGGSSAACSPAPGRPGQHVVEPLVTRKSPSSPIDHDPAHVHPRSSAVGHAEHLRHSAAARHGVDIPDHPSIEGAEGPARRPARAASVLFRQHRLESLERRPYRLPGRSVGSSRAILPAPAAAIASTVTRPPPPGAGRAPRRTCSSIAKSGGVMPG